MCAFMPNMNNLNNMNYNNLQNSCFFPNYNYNNLNSSFNLGNPAQNMGMNNINNNMMYTMNNNMNNMSNMNNMNMQPNNIVNNMNYSVMNNMTNANMPMNNMNIFSSINLNNNMNMSLNNGMNMSLSNSMNMSLNNSINMNINNNMNMSANMNNDNISLNIHLTESNIQKLIVSCSLIITELKEKIKAFYNINYPFKIKLNNKPLNETLTLPESGIENGSNIYIEKLNEDNANNSTKYSFSRYKKAAKTGLKNLGNTDYLNSVLQLLGTIRQLASYFVNPKNKTYFEGNVANKPLSSSFHKFFLHMYPFPEKDDREIYLTDSLFQTLGICNESYASKERKNPNELIEFCLNEIHKELNLKKENVVINTINICESLDKIKVINGAIENFQKLNNSIISNCFFWFELKFIQCQGCNAITYKMNHFPMLKLDISGAMQEYNCPLTISKCLEYQSKKDENQFCQICNTNNLMKINTKIYSSPNLFIFSIDRKNIDQNLLNIPFVIEKNIDIGQFIENQLCPKNFELQGIVSISLGDNNKYVCFGKSPVDKVWYYCNDENVNNINENDVLNNKNFIPCILLYHCCK